MKNLNKEVLFKDYVEVAMRVFDNFETLFATEDIYKSLTGIKSVHLLKMDSEEAFFIAEKHMKTSRAWSVLSETYDYALHGIKTSEMDGTDAVKLSLQIMEFMDPRECSVFQEWQFVVSKAIARYTLDNGLDLNVDQLAELAAVDVRTVRNAMSAGDLMAEKRDGAVYVNNKSARHWLVGRRGFKPTIDTSSNVQELNEVTNAWEFGQYLLKLRLEIGSCTSGQVEAITGVKFIDLTRLESGVFNISLDKVFPLADFYGFDRSLFLKLIMKTFFPDEYIALTEDEGGRQ